jgi:nitroimidazol reductase NimA-like FMN-containing flavoprotein (pyridoxamine 5'-phosphate oxidase superfamily)
MRRNDRELSQHEAMAILQKTEYGILSMTSLEGEPYGVPMNYCVINDVIYFHCAIEGRKLDILSNNNSVSFCTIGTTEILPEEFGTKYESAIVSGKAIEVTGFEKQSALESFLEKYSPQFFNKGIEYIQENISKVKVYKIIINSITGKARN